MSLFHSLLAGGFSIVVAFGAVSANATGTVTAPLADYNSAQVSNTGGVITVPFGGAIANAVYTVSAGTALGVGSNFTVTLPSGFAFQTVPSIVGPAGTTVTFVSGGVGQNSCVYEITGAAVAAGKTLSLGSFSVTGATALESQFGGSPLDMTFQATNNSTSADNDPSPVAVPVFAHAVGSLPDTITPGSGQIDLTVSPPGTEFVASGATIPTSGQVATFAVNTETNDPFNSNAAVLSPNGAVNSLNASDTASVTINGNFIGIAKAYASPTIANCAATVPGGAITGTVTGSSLTFSGVKINTPVQICMIPDGSTLLQASNTPYVFTYSAGTSTDFFGGLSQTTAGNFYSYNGSVLAEVVYTGSISSYPFYIRFDNDTADNVTVVASVRSDGGSMGDTPLTISANTNVLMAASTILQNAGVTLDSTGRANIVFVTVPSSKVSIEQLLVNPDSTVTQIN